MTEYQELVLLKLLVPIVILFVIAIIYFVFNRNQTIANRILASSHSLVAIVGAIYAIIVSRYTSPASFNPHTLNFSKILVLAVILGFICVFLFKGNKKFHFLLFPFVLCVAFIWNIGGMAITHNWA